MKHQPHHNKKEPVYTISVAAKLAGVHPQTLRLYEKLKLIKPHRSPGKTRLYSIEDINRAREAKRIIKEYGVNVTGVKLILELEEQVRKLRDKIALLEEQINQLKSQSSLHQDKL